jgi:hypothetical protein
MAPLNSLFIHGSGFSRGCLFFTGACLSSTLLKAFWCSSLYIKWSNISWYSSYQWLMFVLLLLVGHFESSSPSVTRKVFQWQSWNCLHLWSPNMHRSLGFQVFHLSKLLLFVLYLFLSTTSWTFLYPVLCYCSIYASNWSYNRLS